jgi:hypothetical protein
MTIATAVGKQKIIKHRHQCHWTVRSRCQSSMLFHCHISNVSIRSHTIHAVLRAFLLECNIIRTINHRYVLKREITRIYIVWLNSIVIDEQWNQILFVRWFSIRTIFVFDYHRFRKFLISTMFISLWCWSTLLLLMCRSISIILHLDWIDVNGPMMNNGVPSTVDVRSLASQHNKSSTWSFIVRFRREFHSYARDSVDLLWFYCSLFDICRTSARSRISNVDERLEMTNDTSNLFFSCCKRDETRRDVDYNSNTRIIVRPVLSWNDCWHLSRRQSAELAVFACDIILSDCLTCTCLCIRSCQTRLIHWWENILVASYTCWTCRPLNVTVGLVHHETNEMCLNPMWMTRG